VPSHRSDLVRGRACLRQRRGARLAQAMGGAVMQVRLVTPVAHRVPEAGGRERLSIIGDQKCQVFRRCRRNGGKQVRMSRDIDLDRVPVLVLGLREPDPTIANMLRPEATAAWPLAARAQQATASSRRPPV
jgi:hypothetical protein